MPTRRDFLASAASAVATAALASVGTTPVSSSAATAADAARTTPAGQPGRKLGWALVGIGKLTLGQILPAFANCQKSKLVALVTGHPDKAKPIVDKFALNPASVYGYDNYERLADNPEVD